MNIRIPSRLLFALGAASILSSPAWAKDKPVELGACPAPVQAVLRQYATHGTLEEIELDENKKSGGAATYEAKFTLKDGRRIEVHVGADGKVLLIENKKAKE
ncbi:PepSY domain-containing protein [Verrucomicrobiota bacterium sgz303538]